MQANPVLAEFVRGNWVENRHRGAFCVADGQGRLLAAAGDVERPIFPRSAVKSLQALAMFRSGAVEKFDLDSEMIALACASHNGEPRHVAGVQRFLDRIGLSVDDLECGAHPPTDPAARKALRTAGIQPTALYNNCSGKHSGMLAVALALGAPPQGYTRRDHPVQQLVREMMQEVVGEPLSTDRCGTDGCSIPTWAIPIKRLASGFARMATGAGLPDDIAGASATIFDAITAHPFLIAGTGAFDSEVMQAFSGRLVTKLGADGVWCGAVRDLGLGFALKCDDGSLAAAEVMISGLLASIARADVAQQAVLDARAIRTTHNWRKLAVGHLMATDAVRMTI